jgi:hypothetical protein
MNTITTPYLDVPQPAGAVTVDEWDEGELILQGQELGHGQERLLNRPHFISLGGRLDSVKECATNTPL